MQKTLHINSEINNHGTSVSLLRGIRWGFIGGLVSTLIMDLVLMGVLSAIGISTFSCFSIIGETMSSIFALSGIEITGGILSGIVAHYVIGPVVGIIFGSMMVKFNEHRVRSLRKNILIAFVFVQILSQPLLASSAILLEMTTTLTVLWFTVSFMMHSILAIILGEVVVRGLRLNQNHRVFGQ